MLSGVGMADIVVGRALWDDLVRQIAVRAHSYDGAEDLAHTARLKRVYHPARTPVDDAAAPARTAIHAHVEAAFSAWLNTGPGITVVFETVKATGERLAALSTNYPSMKSVCNRSRA